MNSKPQKSLAILGATPRFQKVLKTGQNNLPAWEMFEETFRDLFVRKYFTNHGPLTELLEQNLSKFLNVKHAITMTNGTIARMFAIKAMNLTGKVIVPSFTSITTIQALTWAGIEPIFCDIDPNTHLITPEHVTALLEDSTVNGILPVHLWGNHCDTEGFQTLSRETGIKVFYDAEHAFGRSINKKISSFNGELEIYSFHASNIFNTGEGGCVCTNNDELAEKLRNLRSSYGRRKSIEIPINGNGRFSEAQAALGLLNLKQYDVCLSENKKRYNLYKSGLAQIPGIKLATNNSTENCNCQNIIIEINSEKFGLSRNQLFATLQKENLCPKQTFSPGAHRCPPYNSNYLTLPETEKICDSVLELFTGQNISQNDVENICDLISLAHRNAEQIKEIVS